MKIEPITIRTANAFVKRYHRHNQATQGGKFAIALVSDDGEIIGVAIAGRPVARHLDDGKTVEITRVCTDGTFNATSQLYGRMRRICQLMGYEKIITYTLIEESGASLRAIGANPVAETGGSQWHNDKRPRKQQNVYTQMKIRWEL